MQKPTLKVTIEIEKVLSNMGLIPPCALENLECATTSLDTYVYVWDYPDIRALSII